jgi:hypothetical protein
VAKKIEKPVAYTILHGYVQILFDADICIELGKYIKDHINDNTAVTAFGQQLTKAGKNSIRNRTKNQTSNPMVEHISKMAFLKVGSVDEFSIPILLDEDFCIDLGKFIEKNGGSRSIKAIGRKLLKAKEYVLKRMIKSVKAKKKAGESFINIGKELGISAATASKYNKL